MIVLTSSNAEADVARSYELNANGYIVKPVDFERLQGDRRLARDVLVHGGRAGP